MSDRYLTHAPPPAIPATLVRRCAELEGELRRLVAMLRPALCRMAELADEVERLVVDDHDRHRAALDADTIDARMLAVLAASGLDACFAVCDDAGIVPPRG